MIFWRFWRQNWFYVRGCTWGFRSILLLRFFHLRFYQPHGKTFLWHFKLLPEYYLLRSKHHAWTFWLTLLRGSRYDRDHTYRKWPGESFWVVEGWLSWNVDFRSLRNYIIEDRRIYFFILGYSLKEFFILHFFNVISVISVRLSLHRTAFWCV